MLARLDGLPDGVPMDWCARIHTMPLPQALEQPAALAAAPGSLWIANSGAHEVLRFDLGTGKLSRLPIGE